MKTNLAIYNNTWYRPGSMIKRGLWYVVSNLVFRSSLFPFSSFKCFVLRIFGAKIGKDVIIKPRVNIKYPWFLSVGDNSWIGEEVWIDNLTDVNIGKNVCLSQGCLLLCGSHDYTKSSFDLILKPIKIDDGVWICAQATVLLGVHCKTHSILTLKSVANKSLEAFGVYQGNPAKLLRYRKISE